MTVMTKKQERATATGGERKAAEGGRKRLQLDFSAEAYSRLEELRQKAGGQKNNAELVRDALRLYEWYLTRRAEGYKVQLAKNGETTTVDLL